MKTETETDLPAIGTPCQVNHPKYDRIACVVTKHISYGRYLAFLCQDATKTHYDHNGEPYGWLCWPEDIGGFVVIGGQP